MSQILTIRKNSLTHAQSVGKTSLKSPQCGTIGSRARSRPEEGLGPRPWAGDKPELHTTAAFQKRLEAKASLRVRYLQWPPQTGPYTMGLV